MKIKQVAEDHWVEVHEPDPDWERDERMALEWDELAYSRALLSDTLGARFNEIFGEPIANKDSTTDVQAPKG